MLGNHLAEVRRKARRTLHFFSRITPLPDGVKEGEALRGCREVWEGRLDSPLLLHGAPFVKRECVIECAARLRSQLAWESIGNFEGTLRVEIESWILAQTHGIPAVQHRHTSKEKPDED